MISLTLRIIEKKKLIKIVSVLVYTHTNNWC